MSCLAAAIQLDLLLAGELGEGAAIELYAHLIRCHACHELLAELILLQAQEKIVRRQWRDKRAVRVKRPPALV